VNEKVVEIVDIDMGGMMGPSLQGMGGFPGEIPPM
jgi:hypothetical protein